MSEPVGVGDRRRSDAGLQLISWARRFMPALAAAGTDLDPSGVVAGRRVGIALPLRPGTAVLAMTLAEAGAEVSVHGSGEATDDAVAAAVASMGVAVHAGSDTDDEGDAALLDRFVDEDIEFLIDFEARCTRHIHRNRRDGLGSLLGVVEETPDGAAALRSLEERGDLDLPCLVVDDSRTRQLFGRSLTTAQSVVMSIVDLTNIQLQGKTVVVIGYGPAGRGIAGCAHALGARVVVTEIDPVRALRAVIEGHRVERLLDVCPTGDLFITAAGVGGCLTADHARLMKDGALLATGGAGDGEVDLGRGRPLTIGPEARRQVRQVAIDAGRSVFLIADGRRPDIVAAGGAPIEIMDLLLALQCRTLQYLIENEGSIPAGVHRITSVTGGRDGAEDVDLLVARSVLAARGIGIDSGRQSPT